MPAKFRFDHLCIKRGEYKRILRWSLSYHEIGALCFGSGNLIEHVARVPNTLKSREYFEWDWEERARAIVHAGKLGLHLVAEAHSHPLYGQLSHPSRADTKYFEQGRPHLIAFPLSSQIKCWILRSTVQATKESEIDLLISG